LIVVTVHAEALAPVARIERAGRGLSHLQYHVLVHQTIRQAVVHRAGQRVIDHLGYVFEPATKGGARYFGTIVSSPVLETLSDPHDSIILRIINIKFNHSRSNGLQLESFAIGDLLFNMWHT
jgi:hypothetical protein